SDEVRALWVPKDKIGLTKSLVGDHIQVSDIDLLLPARLRESNSSLSQTIPDSTQRILNGMALAVFVGDVVLGADAINTPIGMAGDVTGESTLNLYGQNAPNTEVVVTRKSIPKSFTVTTDDEGKWSMSIPLN